jgi:hypothetical protein
LDSFVVGTKAKGLKGITLASGGKCYFPETLDYGLQLFEDEAILSAALREIVNVPKDINNLDLS